MPHDPALTALLATHAAELQALLPPHLWPLAPFKTEQFGPLTKYTLGQLPDGRWAMLHHVTEPDASPPHCHPVAMDSHGIAGSYVERIFADGHSLDVLRPAGGQHHIPAERVHQLVALPQGDCWTLCFAGPVVREWRHHPELLVA